MSDLKDEPGVPRFSPDQKSSEIDSQKFRRALTALLHFIFSLIRIGSKLRAVWGIFFVLGLSITIFAGCGFRPLLPCIPGRSLPLIPE